MPRTLIKVGIAVGVLFAIWFLVDVANGDRRYVTPVDASISADGSELVVLVPFLGGCADRTQFPYYKFDGGSLVVWVEDETGEFTCLAGCLGEPCTETLTARIDPPVDPTSRIVFRNPGPGSPLKWIAWIAALGLGGLVVTRIRPRRRLRPELLLYESDGEEMGAGPED